MLTKIGKELKTGVRSLWSQDRRRIKWGELDLDLSYIGEDIIAMALPGYGSLMATIRNSDDEYAAFLNHHHRGHYRIWNLSELSYDNGKFDVNSVVDAGWPDHHNPPLALAFIHLDRMFSYLLQDPKNKVVVHCVAGKGRTGCLIAMLLLYRQQCTEAKEALLRFARARLEEDDVPKVSMMGDGSDIGGVRNPSQIRYVEYVAQLLYGNYRLSKHPIILLRLEIRNGAVVKDMATPYVVLSRYDSGKEELMIASEPGVMTVALGASACCNPLNERKTSESKIVIEVNRLLEQGDYVLRIKHGGFVGELLDTTIAWVGFHTAMLWPTQPNKHSTWKLPKSQLDQAFKNKMSLPEDFEVSIIYQTDYAETVPPVQWTPLLQKRAEYLETCSRRRSSTSSAQSVPSLTTPASSPSLTTPASSPSEASSFVTNDVPLEDFLSGFTSTSPPSLSSSSLAPSPYSHLPPVSSSVSSYVYTPLPSLPTSTSVHVSPPSSAISPRSPASFLSYPSSASLATSSPASSLASCPSQFSQPMHTPLLGSGTSKSSASSSILPQLLPSSVDVPPSGNWSCLACTFLNSALLPFCEMCTEARRGPSVG